MSVTSHVADHHADASVRLTHSFLDQLFADDFPTQVAIDLWDGSTWPAARPEAKLRWKLNHPGALPAMLRDTSNDLALAEAYLFDDIDLQGDLALAFPLARQLRHQDWSPLTQVGLYFKLRRLDAHHRRDPHDHAAHLTGSAHSPTRDRQAVAHHYDVGNSFYQLFLDEHLVYSCAYFTNPQNTLTEAQTHKLDYLCRKLRLHRGQQLLDVGCGWGALLMHAARHYGVRAVGITLSQEQAKLARTRIAQADLSPRCVVELCDYRELDQLVHTHGHFDAAVSVGMVEHVGTAQLPRYFQHLAGALKEGGVLLNHGIGAGPHFTDFKSPSFRGKYVFPDGELQTLGTVLLAAETAPLHICDVENLRPHYALTLDHWVQRLERSHELARRLVGETTYRIWRLYMAGSAYAFRTGDLHLYQTLLVKPHADGSTPLPLTRADWYR